MVPPRSRGTVAEFGKNDPRAAHLLVRTPYHHQDLLLYEIGNPTLPLRGPQGKGVLIIQNVNSLEMEIRDHLCFTLTTSPPYRLRIDD